MVRGHRGLAMLGGRALLVLAAALVVVPSRVVPDLGGDRAALLALRDAAGRHLPWDASAVSPCTWRGVTCRGGRVVELRLPAASLRGEMPVGTVGNLTALRTLSLRFNAISGGIPSDIGGCAELRQLYLHGNSITGGVPEGLFSLALLKKLDLSGNRLTGGVSSEFNRLTQLATLLLDGNELNGTLPAGLDLPKLRLFNVSYNGELAGPVPASLAGMPASAFLGTALCGGPLAPCAGDGGGGGGKRGKFSVGAIAGIVAGGVLSLVLVLAVVFLMCCRGRGARASERSAEMAADVHGCASPMTVTVATTDKNAVKRSHSPPAPTSDGKKLVFLGNAPETPYDLDTLLRASAEVLGKGGFGTTYRATLEGGGAVLVVKRLREVHLSEREFRDRVADLSALRHDNLPQLLAYYYSKEEKLLVYNFVGAGSLSSILHGNDRAGRARLEFTARARIALAAARGVAFIHGAGAQSSHGNIKSSNVVVTATQDGAYVTDHGLKQLIGPTVLPKRGAGYRAPEVTDARNVSQKADVYSFGVLVLELLTGRAPAHALPDGDGVDLPRWVRSVVQEEWTAEVFDAGIANEPYGEEEMMRLLQLGMDCTEQHPDRRPAMAEVEARMQRIVEDLCRKADGSTDGSRSVSA